jgi:hypothetical protein
MRKEKEIIIHKSKNPDNTTTYFFTKSKNECISIVYVYDKQWDYGKSSSGVHLSDIEIHYHNSYIKDNLTEIQLKDVPEAIIDLLSYLK